MALLPADATAALHKRTMLLDTNAFVNGYSHPREFSDLLDELIGTEHRVR
jgi:hypothetical protein